MQSVLAAGSAAGTVDLDVPAIAWVALFAVLGAMLATDLFAHRHDDEPTPRRALVESLVWVGCGVGFGFAIAATAGGAAAGEYFSGYLVEKSLSIDNVFVWAIIFSTFAIPLRLQHRVLFWGVFGALLLRGMFIAATVTLIERLSWTLVLLGAFLIFTGVKVVRHRAGEGMHGHDRAVGFLRRFLPVSTSLDGHRFFTRMDGRRAATPLLATLVVVELTDVVFAVESVPTVLAVTREPFLVFSANAFALLGMRAAYFVLAGWNARLHYLGHGLGVVLVFVGTKMLLSNWVHVPTLVSLSTIVVIITTAVAVSLLHDARAKERSPV